MPRLRPVTERILAPLPGPRLLWIVAWALVPWVNAGANLLFETGARSAVWEQSRALVVLNYAALSFAIVITLWGTERIARRSDMLREKTASLAAGDGQPFREMNSVGGPVVASVATALAFCVSALASDGWTSGLLRGATWFVLGIAFWAFLWTYASLQLGLIRLGRERLVPKVGTVDPTLGLLPLGRAAFTGLWMLLAWLVPLVLTGLPDVVGVSIGALVLAGALSAFFLSLLRLHWQMVEVKESELAIARELYAEAYDPVRTAPSLGVLERRHRLLGAADALEKRAQAIHEWPIDEGTMAWVITITTSVIAVGIARLILSPLGL
jgi:hypothetical protein